MGREQPALPQTVSGDRPNVLSAQNGFVDSHLEWLNWGICRIRERIGEILRNFLGIDFATATIWVNRIHGFTTCMTDNRSGTAIDWPAALAQHRPWLRKVIGCRVRDPHQVDDLMQEVAVAALDSNQPIDPAAVAPWLYRVAVRQAINFHRRSGKKSAARPVAELDPLDDQSEPLDWLLQVERQAAVRQALDQLRAQDREILTLKYTENWNYRQLAQHLGVKERTIEYRLMRARKELRRLLAETSV